MSAGAIRPNKIATVIIPVADQDGAVDFYVTKLGFEKRVDVPFGDGYLPHSASVLPVLSDKTGGYSQTKSALHFPLDEPLPRELVRELIEVKLRERRSR